MTEHGDAPDLAQSIQYVEEQIAKASCSSDPSSLFSETAIACGVALHTHNTGQFHKQLATIRRCLNANVAKDWDGKVRQEKRKQEKEDKALARDARRVWGNEDMESPLPDMTAHEFGLNVFMAEPTSENKTKLFRLINDEYALVPISGKTRYMTFGPQGEMRLCGPDDVAAIFRNVVVDKQNAFTAWCEWPKRRTFRGVGFFPGSSVNKPQVPNGYFNTWKGFQVRPKRGSWKLLDAHLRNVVCAGNLAHANFLYDWLAHLVQAPQRKVGTALVLKSDAEGSGKSLLVNNVLKPIFGDAATTIDKAEKLTGKFNSFLEHTVVVGVEEAIWAGSKSDAGVVKNVITNPKIRIERKGLDDYEALNYARLIFTSNEDWVVPTGPLARRFFVLEVKNPQANQPAYFDPLFQELERGGVEAFLHDMLKRKITSQLNQPPFTEALSEQRKLSMTPVESWAFQVARSGTIEVPSDRRGDTDSFKLQEGLTIPCVKVRDAVGKGMNLFQLQNLEHKLGKLLTNPSSGLGVTRVKTRRGWEYKFPSLSEFRSKCAKRFKVTIDTFEGQTYEADTGRRSFPFSTVIDKYIRQLSSLPNDFSDAA